MPDTMVQQDVPYCQEIATSDGTTICHVASGFDLAYVQETQANVSRKPEGASPRFDST